MNSFHSTSTPFLGLGGKPPAASGNSPLLSASANDVAASFSELLRGSSAKPAAMTPPVEPPPPAQQAPSRPVPPPKADAGPTQAQVQAKVDRANSQDRETLARQSQARSAQARSEAAAGRNAERVAKPETATVKDGKAAVEGKDSIDKPTSAPAESASETDQKTAQPTEPALVASLTPLPIDTKAIKGGATEDGKTDARSATAKSGKAQLADIGGHATAGAATGATTGETASAAGAAARDTAAGIALEGMQASAAKPAAPANAANATPSFEAVMNSAQAQLAQGGIDTTAPSAASAPAARLELAQPLHSPAFGPEMAARLSLLAADGVQQAQLHLNPAEMGPVSVQIVVEGQQAQISFHSDQADTRAVLENSLPELAAALRESGLTLSGGGVFQQARHPEEQAQPAAGRHAARAEDSADAVPVSMPIRTTASRGVLDLYA